MVEASIIIPSIGREKELQSLRELLKEQFFKRFEVIVVDDEGPLAALRNKGAKKAVGKYLVFIDDDIRPTRLWLHSIVSTFRMGNHICGVTGPATIEPRFRVQRDIFRFRAFKFLYDQIFVGKQRHFPGRIAPSGAWSTRACDKGCCYEGEVDFLEACNMAWKASDFWKVGGFDEQYEGVGDWSEPDLAFRIRKMGGTLWFSRNAKVYHEPSRSGAFKKRKADAQRRLQNYYRFSKLWIKPSFKHSLYKLFLRSYYGITSFK